MTIATAPVAPPPRAAEPPDGETRRGLRDMRATLLMVSALLLASLVAVAIAYAVKDSAGPAGDIQATTVNFKVVIPIRLATGTHTIGLTNNGSVDHEVVLFKTDLPANNLPLKADGDVNEESPLLMSVGDSGEPLKAGGTESFKTADLSPGHYVAVCNLPGHYRLGMKLDVTVH
jgi:plastocyanin